MTEGNVKERLAKVEAELAAIKDAIKKLAMGMKVCHDLVESESGEEVMAPGTEIYGIKF